MIDDELLERLRCQGEGPALDFKQAQYPFVDASDHQKSELLKDILAMANAYRDGPGYILIGFKDLKPHPAEVIGITDSDRIDDAALQQFVNSKVDPRLDFHYEERMFEGKHVAVIVVPKQDRPFASTKDFGIVRRGVVYIRRGSSTGEALPSEFRMMVRDDNSQSKLPSVDLHLDDEKNKQLQTAIELHFMEFDDFPDYSARSKHPFDVPFVNRDFYRELAAYFSVMQRLIVVRPWLVNRSTFPLEEVKLELTCTSHERETVEILRHDDLPGVPSSSSSEGLFGKSMVQRLQERVRIDGRGSAPICHISLGTLRPGETGRAEDDVAVLPSGPGNFSLHVRILAKEISHPIEKSHDLKITGAQQHMDLHALQRLLHEGNLIDVED